MEFLLDYDRKGNYSACLLKDIILKLLMSLRDSVLNIILFPVLIQKEYPV